ncbi:hypothetical protein WA588_005018 [Blastocystis sp. NMH]
MSVITLIPSASLSAFLLEGSNASALPLPQGMEKMPARPTSTFFAKVVSALVKKVYQAKSVKVTHACVLGDSSPITFKVIFKSLGDICFYTSTDDYLPRIFERKLKSALASKESVAPLYSEKKEVKVTSSLPHYMMATAASKQHQPSVKKEEEEKKKLPKENGDEKKPSPVRERNGVFPHYLMATAASMAKQQPCVKKDEEKMEEKRRVVSVPCVKKEKMEAGIPSYMRSTASSRAMDQTRPLKKEEKRLAPSCAMKGETRGKAVPHYLQSTASSRAKEVTQKKEEKKMVVPLHDSVPIHPSMAKKASHEVKGTLQEEEKRRPLYLATTASMRAMTLPTKKYVKRESRLPPRMMLKKHGVVPSVLAEEKEQEGAVPAAPEETAGLSQNPAPNEVAAVEKQKETTIPSSQVKEEEEKPVKSSLEGSTSGTQKSSISTSPDRAVSLPAKKEEEKKKATPVIKASPCVAIKKASTNPPTKILTFVTCRRGGDVSASSDEELDRELLALSHKDNPCPCERE